MSLTVLGYNDTYNIIYVVARDRCRRKWRVSVCAVLVLGVPSVSVILLVF